MLILDFEMLVQYEERSQENCISLCRYKPAYSNLPYN